MVALVTGLMAMTAYSSFIVAVPEYHPTPGIGSFENLTVCMAMFALGM